MTFNHHDHLHPIFSWMLMNHTNETISAKSRSGMEWLIKPVNPTRDVSGGAATISVEIKNVLVNNIAFNPAPGCSKLDRDIMMMLEQRRQAMLSNNYLDRTMTQTLCVEILLKQTHVESDDGVHSDILGVSFFMDNDLTRRAQQAIAKGTPTSINNTLMWEPEPQEELVDHTEEIKKLCLITENRVTVLYNDPTNVFSGLWMNVFGQAKSLFKANIPGVLPGLYITCRLGTSNSELSERYYSFDQLDPRVLEEIGIFLSKDEAQKGGNTERYVQAENLIKGLRQDISNNRKEIAQLNDKNINLIKDLNKEETTTLRLTNEIAFLKQDSRLKDREQKIAMETIKNAGKPNNTASFVDICKGLGLLTTAGATVYKLATST